MSISDQEKNMKTDYKKIIFNKNDLNGERFFVKATFTMTYDHKDVDIVLSLN